MSEEPCPPERRAVSPLWCWMGLRISGLAAAAVLSIAFCMWVYFELRDYAALSGLSPSTQTEIRQLVADPHRDPARLWELFAANYEIEPFLPGLRNPDWLTLLVLLVLSLPLLGLFGFTASRSLSRQFSRVAGAARRVAQHDFTARAEVICGAPAELVTLAHDFNQMTERLEQQQREVLESSAVLAHELRTPLNAAMGRLQGMLDDVFPREDAQILLVHRQLEQINRLVGDLHLLSLARAGRLWLEVEPFNVREVVEERIDWVEAELDRLGIWANVEMPDDLVVIADRHRIGQVLSVIIDNLIRYAAQGRALDVVASSDGHVLTLAIGDRGAGVTDADLPMLCDRFWRVEASRARHSGGSGLGLAIAAAICHAHGGELSVSNREGGGLLVKITLPLTQALANGLS